MRILPMIALLLAITVSASAAEESVPRVELYGWGTKGLTAEKQVAIVSWSETFLKSANFDTANQPDILKQSVSAIQNHYRKTVRGDCLVVSYDRPRILQTIGGKVTALQIVIGVNENGKFAAGLFSIDPEGRIVAHEKYAPLIPPGLLPKKE